MRKSCLLQKNKKIKCFAKLTIGRGRERGQVLSLPIWHHRRPVGMPGGASQILVAPLRRHRGP